MPRLPVVSGREAGQAFSKIGFAYDRTRGSHMIYYRLLDGHHLSIPDHRELDRGLLRTLIRTADISVEEFVRLLQDA